MLKPGSTALPVGFNTGYKTTIQKYIGEIDTVLEDSNSGKIVGNYEITQSKALEVIYLIYKTIEIEVKTA